MNTVIIHWDHHSNMGQVGILGLYKTYDYTCRAMDAELRIVDVLDICPLEIVKYSSLEAALSGVIGQVVCLDPSASMTLGSYQHPVDACYIIGPDYETYIQPDGSDKVRIMTPVDLVLWSHSALAMVLYDRVSKGD